MTRPRVSMRIRNDRLLEEALRIVGETMGVGTQQRIVKAALKGAGGLILKEAKKRAPRQKRQRGGPARGGNLKRSLAISKGRRIRKYGSPGQRKGFLMAILGPSWPLGAHGHLVELGTKRRKLKGEGKYPAGTNRGRMRRQPFLKPAYKGKVRPAMRDMRRRLWDGIEKAWNRRAAKMRAT